VTSMWSETRESWDRAISAVAAEGQPAPSRVRVRRLWFRRANVPILITGRPGAGKSALYDAITGQVGALGYRTAKSPDWERHRVVVRTPRTRTRAAIIVVPGQDSDRRERVLDKTLRHGHAPEGIIHVVCWGYNKLWSDTADGTVRELQMTPTHASNEEMREEMLERERDDFAKMCELIRGEGVGQRLKWMIIAVAKADLYWARKVEVRDYYIPGTGARSPFKDIIGGLVAGNGTLPPRISIVPFAAHPEAHVYAHDLYRTPAQLDNVQATTMLDGFYGTLEQAL
jgi:hypothetical protein